ncbi:MAG TPA: glycosyltransferase family 4 protein, partial [Polyangia bacterium]|nr:glycosyltransferase family 4 protein [Polyangia bacterium]
AAMLRALDAHYGPRAAPAAVIPTGLARPRGLRGAKRPLVFAAGRLWDHGKNIAALAAAAPALPWRVVVAGDGAIGGGPAAAGVHQLGRLDAQGMAAAYRWAAIYALPARYEPFGLSILEAAQHGCALVLGDIDSLRENWSDAALFVPPDDVDGLTRALRLLIADPHARRRLAHRARRRARCFSSRRMCRATLDLYRQALTGHQASARPHETVTLEEANPACAS